MTSRFDSSAIVVTLECVGTMPTTQSCMRGFAICGTFKFIRTYSYMLIIKIEVTKATQILLKIYAKALHLKLHLDFNSKLESIVMANLSYDINLENIKTLANQFPKSYTLELDVLIIANTYSYVLQNMV